MLIRLTDELKAQAMEVASLYQPLREPLLVGSCVWLGEGNDIDVVVFVDDVKADRGGSAGSFGRGGKREGVVHAVDARAAYGGMATYRHGPVNIVAIEDERIWAGWRYAAEIMPHVPKVLIAAKADRVDVCAKLRELGEKQCQSA